MKKVLSLVLVFAMVLGMMPVFAAGETGAEQLYKYGFVAGNNGDLMVDKTLTRAEMAVLYAEMFGLKDEAANYSAPADFSDVNDHWSKPYVAYAQAQGWMGGYPDGTFKPEASISGQEFATVMLKALGQFNGWDTVIADAQTIGLSANTAASLTRGNAFETMWKAVNMPAKGETVALGVKLGKLESAMVSEGPLAVDTVTANTVKSFEVKFKNVVADTSKVTFEVKRDTTKIALTAAWNEAKTVATLSSAAKLPEGNYTVVVNDATAATPVALGTFKVTIEKEKIASVEFDSDTIMRTSDISGVVGYKVLNQYGEDVTNGTLGRGINWIVSTNSYDADEKQGVLTVTQGKIGEYNSQLRTYNTVVVTAQDTSVGFASTKTFKVSDTINVVQDVKINGVVNEKGEAVTFAYDVAQTYYLDVTALDANGKEIKSYAVLNSKANQVYKTGTTIIDPNSGQYILDVRCSSTNYIKINYEKHPLRSGEMAYRLELLDAPDYDTKVTFMALATYSGKSTNAVIDYGRDVTVEKFSLQTPAETVSSGKVTEFPFEAFDQYGKAVTDFDKLDGKVDFTGNKLYFVRQADGSAKLYGKFTNTGTSDLSEYITATVKQSTHGANSSISFVVKEAARPETIQALSHTYAYTNGAQWDRRIDKIKIFDQFDRLMNLRTDKDNYTYQVKVTTSDKDVVDVSTSSTVRASGGAAGTGSEYSVTINEDEKVFFTGGSKVGSATITYTLVDATNAEIDSASTTAYNLSMSDVTSAFVEFEGQKILMLEKYPTYYTGGQVTGAAVESDIVVDEPDVFGKTSSGKIVRLTSDRILGLSVDNSKFTVLKPSQYTGAYEIIANGDFGTDKTAETTVTAAVYGTKGTLSTSVKITALADAPKATDIIFSFQESLLRNSSFVVTNDVVEVKAATMNALNGMGLLLYNKDGSKNALNTDMFKIKVDTNYGGSNGIVDNVYINKIASGTNSNSAFSANITGTTSSIVTSGTFVVGDKFSVAVTAGSLTKTMIFEVK